MAKKTKVNISGMQELKMNLQKIRGNIDKDNIEDAIVSGVDILSDQMEQEVPVRTGFGKEHIGQETDEKKKHSVSINAGPEGEAFYLAIQEVGSKFFPAQPWMRPAFDKSKDEIEDTIKFELNKLITQF